ncbi:MAG: hypothetical protein WB713_08350 [Methyloceanibacter sp.]
MLASPPQVSGERRSPRRRCSLASPFGPSGWFAKEVRRPEDIKGLRMRGFGLGRVMSRLGATTVLVPGGSLGNAFDKHEIDAAAFLTPAVDQRQRVQDHGTY